MASFATNLGIKAISDIFIADDTYKYVGWGSGSGQTVASTDLATALAEGRVTGTMASATTNTADDTTRVTATITATGTRAVTEMGVFNGAGSGSPPAGATLGFYSDFSVINVASGDTITFTIDIVFDQV